MIAFFKSKNSEIYAVHATNKLTELDIEKYSWVFSGAEYLDSKIIHEKFIGPRKTMVTPWSTNAVEIVQNMGICGVLRIEMFTSYKNDSEEFSIVLVSITVTWLPTELYDCGVLLAEITITGISFEKTLLKKIIKYNIINDLNNIQHSFIFTHS